MDVKFLKDVLSVPTISSNETIQINLKVKSDNRPQMKCGSGKCGSM